MARSAFVLGGTGHIGRAVVPLLLSAGWDVTVAARNRSSPVSDLDVRFVELDRDEGLELRGGFDAVIDVVPYTAEHARQRFVSTPDRSWRSRALRSTRTTRCGRGLVRPRPCRLIR